MRDTDPTLFPLDFNGSLRIEARPERLTGDAGAVVLRDVIERLSYTKDLAAKLHDTRHQDFITHPLEELLNTTLCLLGQGWRDRDDADALRDDPVMRLAASVRRGVAPLIARPEDERRVNRNPEDPDGLASQPTLSRMAHMLGSKPNRRVLRTTLLKKAVRRIRAMRGGRGLRYVTLDVDSLPAEVAGHQPGSAFNGHYHERIYHPLIASIAETGDMIDAKLREGNVHTAKGALGFILPLVKKVEKLLCMVAAVRFDAGFPEEKTLAGLEARRIPYLARIKNNAVLDRMADPYEVRPPGRRTAEPRVWFHEMTYRAKSWSRARRVVLVVLERVDDLLLDHFWIITNWTPAQMDGPALLEHYRDRGTAEGYMGEVMDVIDPALSSSPRPKSHYRNRVPATATPSGDSFAVNETLLLLNLMAYNIVHATRVLVETATGVGWSLRRVRERVLKVPARVLIHGHRAVMVVTTAAAVLWKTLWPKMRLLRIAET